MVGRANRSQGIQRGHVFVTSTVAPQAEPGFTYIEKLDKQVGVDMGPELIGAIVKLWDTLNVGMRN